MAKVIFYEVAGCASNARQKALLAAFGHELDAGNLLTQTWTEVALLRRRAGRSALQSGVAPREVRRDPTRLNLCLCSTGDDDCRPAPHPPSAHARRRVNQEVDHRFTFSRERIQQS
jgi:hypothetical protein